MIRFGGRIPISIYPTFWVVAALIGYFNSLSWSGTLIWMGIIFVSVLFHEFGHALTALAFGKNPRIELVAMGGLTYHDSENLPFWKQFFIVLNGPVFGFFLFLLATALLYSVSIQNPQVLATVRTVQWVNLFWTVLNLLPVMPLDGGQLLRVVCEGIWGVRGFKYALIASTSIATLISLGFFLYQAFLVGAIFFLLAFQSFDTWRKSRLLTTQDRSEKLKKEFEAAEKALHAGRIEEARELLFDIRTRAKEGMLFLLSTQFLAYLDYEEGKSKEAYDLLLPLQDQLSHDALSLLHKAAFEQKNYPLVVELGGPCFQAFPSVETALLNAYATGVLGQAEASVGWLQTAVSEGLENIQEITLDPLFDSVRGDALFKEFISTSKQA